MADNGLDKFVTGMIFGAAVGAAIGLLLAPKPGTETRQLVRERAGDYFETARDRAGEYAGPARERAGEYIGTARERAGEYIGTARDRVQNIRRRGGQDGGEEVSAPVLEDE